MQSKLYGSKSPLCSEDCRAIQKRRTSWERRKRTDEFDVDCGQLTNVEGNRAVLFFCGCNTPKLSRQQEVFILGFSSILSTISKTVESTVGSLSWRGLVTDSQIYRIFRIERAKDRSVLTSTMNISDHSTACLELRQGLIRKQAKEVCTTLAIKSPWT